MRQLFNDDGTLTSESMVRNVVYQFDDYFRFSELMDKLKEKGLDYNSKYVGKVLDEMIYYGSLKKYGVYFKVFSELKAEVRK